MYKVKRFKTRIERYQWIYTNVYAIKNWESFDSISENEPFAVAYEPIYPVGHEFHV